MGLLSSPKAREKVLTVISKYSNKAAVLSYIAGLVYFCALVHPDVCNRIYLSENALLPGLVTSQFESDFGASKYYKSLRNELNEIKTKLGKKSAEELSELTYLPTDWLEKQFREIGLETYVQNYTFKYPFNIYQGKELFGQNFYSVLRAPRAGSTEALVISVPFRFPIEGQENTTAGIPVQLALARAFKRHNYWAKDIIFVVTYDDTIGMQAWLDGYHYRPHKYIFAQDLLGRSGAIQAAINLEIPSEKFSHLDLVLEGLNGKLPNLDLVTTTHRLCSKEHVTCTQQDKSDYWQPASWEGLQHAGAAMLSMMLKQASNGGTGNHGLFQTYNIEALTLRGIKAHKSKAVNLEKVGRVMEGIFRSLNNLLERFHQSFFFYLLPSTSHYVSIGLYMPPFGLLAVPILIKALSLWIKYRVEAEASKSDSADENKETDLKKQKKEKAPTKLGFISIISSLCLAVAFGLTAYGLPTFFVNTGTSFHLRPAEGLLVGLMALELAVILCPWTLKRNPARATVIIPSFELLKSVALLLLGMALAVTALLNISLAVFIVVLWTPVVTSIVNQKPRLVVWIQRLLLIAISPLNALIILFFVQSTMDGKPFQEAIGYSWMEVQFAVLSSAISECLHGNWMYPLMTLVYFPIWLLFWVLAWAKNNTPDKNS